MGLAAIVDACLQEPPRALQHRIDDRIVQQTLDQDQLHRHPAGVAHVLAARAPVRKAPVPMLVRRHSALWLDRDAVKKVSKFGFTAFQFFDDTDALVRSFVAQNASGEVSLELEINELKKIFEQVAAKALAIDPTLEKAVLAESVKAVGGLEQWQGRLVRSEKQKHETTLNQLRTLKEKLFPASGLQERHDNFLSYILKYGDGFIQTLKEHFAPFDPGFVVLEEEQ